MDVNWVRHTEGLVLQANKEKRLEWACAHIQDDFEDVVWTDETYKCHTRFMLQEERRTTPPKASCQASSQGGMGPLKSDGIMDASIRS